MFLPDSNCTFSQMIKIPDKGYTTIFGAEDTIVAITSEMYVEASNEYGVFEREFYPWLEDIAGSQIVEPYKQTTLTLTGSLVDSSLQVSIFFSGVNGSFLIKL